MSTDQELDANMRFRIPTPQMALTFLAVALTAAVVGCASPTAYEDSVDEFDAKAAAWADRVEDRVND